MKKTRRSMLIPLLAATLATPVLATDYTWTGTTNNTWSTGTNWGGTAPANAASTAIFFGLSSPNVTPNLTTQVTVGSIMFKPDASAFTLTRSGSNTLTLATGGSVTNSSSNLQTFNTPVVLGGSSTWDAASGAITANGAITGAGGSLTKVGAGTLTLSGANTYTGGTTISGGTLQLGGSAGKLGTGGVTNNGVLSYNGIGTITESNVITGTGSLNQTGTGTTILTAANTYEGGTTITNGALQFNSPANFGSGPLTVSGTSATLQWAPGNTDGLAGGVTLVGAGRLDTNGNDITLATPLTSAAKLIKAGNGALTLNSAPNLTSLVVQGGTLRLGADNAVPAGRPLEVGSVVTGGSATFDLNGHDLAIGSLNMGGEALGSGSINSVNTGAATLTLGGILSNTYTNGFESGTAVIAGKLSLSAGAHQFFTADYFSQNIEINVTADVGGTGGIYKTGGGNLVLGGTNTYTGNTTISNGTLRAVLPTSGNLNINGGVYELAGDRTFVAGTGAGQVQFTGGGFSAFGANRTVNLTDTGGNSLNLVWGGGNFVTNGSSLVLSSIIADSTVTLANNINLNGATRTVTVNDGTAATDAVITGVVSNGGLSINGAGTLKLNGANPYAGGTAIDTAAVEFASGSLGSGAVTLNNGSRLRWAAGNTDAAQVVLGTNSSAGSNTLDTNGNDVTLNAGLTSTSSSAPKIAKAGEGVLTLNASSNFSTAYVTVAGGTLRFGAANAVGGSGTFGIITVNGQTPGGNATFDTNGQNFGTYIVTFGGATARADVTNTVSTGSGTLSFTNGGGINYNKATLAANDPGAAFLTGKLAILGSLVPFAVDDSSKTTTELTVSADVSGAFGVTKSGAGTLVLSGNNTYTGTTTLNGGTLRAASSAALGTNGLVYGSNGGTLELAGDGITLANAITLGSATRTISTLDGPAVIDGTLTGGISGTGGLTKTGGGTLRLSGAKAFTGNTTVSAGTLQYATQNALYSGTTSNWTATKLTVQSGATAAFNVGGTGEFTAANIDTLKALGTGTGGLRSGSTLGLDTNNAAGGNFTYASTIANPNAGANVLGLAKFGSNTLTLTGASTYTGGTTVNAGTLLANSATGSATGTGAVNVIAGTLGGTGSIAGAVTVGDGVLTAGLRDATLSPGASVGTLATGALAFSADAVYRIELDGTTSSTSDLTGVTGTVALGSGVASLGASYLAGAIGDGQQYFVIANDGTDSIAGYFADLQDLDGSISSDDPTVLTAGVYSLKISYTGDLSGGTTTGGNDVVLYTTSVPEPTVLGVVAGLAATLVRRRRRVGAA